MIVCVDDIILAAATANDYMMLNVETMGNLQAWTTTMYIWPQPEQNKCPLHWRRAQKSICFKIIRIHKCLPS